MKNFIISLGLLIISSPICSFAMHKSATADLPDNVKSVQTARAELPSINSAQYKFLEKAAHESVSWELMEKIYESLDHGSGSLQKFALTNSEHANELNQRMLMQALFQYFGYPDYHGIIAGFAAAELKPEIFSAFVIEKIKPLLAKDAFFNEGNIGMWFHLLSVSHFINCDVTCGDLMNFLSHGIELDMKYQPTYKALAEKYNVSEDNIRKIILELVGRESAED